MNDAFKYLFHKLVDSHDKWYPFISVYYLTYRCRFRCPYCSDGLQRPYYSLPDEDPDPLTALSILKEIRKHCEYVVITGGEPLEYSYLDEILNGIEVLGFKGVVLTTNGYDVEKHLPSLAGSVDTLVFSLDTLDHQKADRWYDVGSGALEKILSNIETAACFAPRKYQITISCVVTPENLDDVYKVYEYTERNGFTLAASPQLVGVKAHDTLLNNWAYRDLYDFLIKEKKRGGDVYGTTKYLEYMRDFTKFECRPFTMLVVSPSGSVYYPCLELGKNAGNILKNGNLHQLRCRGRQAFGAQPSCDARCHSPCALGFALILKYPLSIVGEASCMLKKAFRRPARLRRGFSMQALKNSR